MPDTVYMQLRLDSWVVSVREKDAVRQTWFTHHEDAAAFRLQERERLNLLT